MYVTISKYVEISSKVSEIIPLAFPRFKQGRKFVDIFYSKFLLYEMQVIVKYSQQTAKPGLGLDSDLHWKF